MPLPVLSASLINFVPRYLSVSTRATVGKNRIQEIFFFLSMNSRLEKLGHEHAMTVKPPQFGCIPTTNCRRI